MSDQDSFPALNLPVLKNLSKNWCKRFLCIEDVSLFKSFDGSKYKYCIVLTGLEPPRITKLEEINLERASFEYLEGYWRNGL